MELDAEDVVALDRRGEAARVRGGADATGCDRRRVRVREVDVRAGFEPLEQPRPGLHVERVPANVGNLEASRGVAPQALHAPGQYRQAGHVGRFVTPLE